MIVLIGFDATAVYFSLFKHIEPDGVNHFHRTEILSGDVEKK